MKMTVLVFASLLTASQAFAHIDLDTAGTHKSRYGRGDIKRGPCGKIGGTRGSNVYTYEPGQTITVKIDEYVPHPGYFRIAFDNDGDDSFANPQTILPINRECMRNDKDKCGATDFYNNPTVLMDNVEPHLRGDRKTYTWDVKLPDVECDNCTLQIIQVMTDPYPIHAPYDPAYTSEDVYYQCIDMVLKRNPS